MTLKKESKDFYKYFRFIIIPVVFIGFYLLAYMIDPYRPWSGFFKRDTTEILTEWGFVSIFCLLITEISLAIARALDRKVPWVSYPISRFFLQFSIQIIASILFLYFYLHATLSVFGGETRLDDLNSLALRQSFVVSMLLSVLISLIFTGNFFLQQWKAAMLETSNLNLKAAELKQIALESELQSLKMQLDPHFMFNNFSTLSALIAEDANSAQHFLENLSRVYRYMIINVHKNIISVEEEIRFAEAYFYLIKIRLGENIKMQVTLSDEVLKKGIPPITLQLLIENAIKHNTASRSKPLTININEDDQENLVITNSLQRLNYNIPSTCTGLKNIESRYRLLSDKLPEVTETESLFIVKLPLMNI
ncbi:Sensor histidine kinase YehU [compost metagenome]|uniref:sensor histidine kinase n=1 Tax=Pedobacter sp. ok626 TaxID=1761882 RepID=UPI00088CD27F|nr:histidine kinase [Pedobacter sp. ok626]SDL12722.1 Histidine kinase [Pedobacter sp. ok626]